MKRAIERFVHRLDLPKNINFKLKNCWENYNPDYLLKFERLKKNNYTLELYHTIRFDAIDIFPICQDGFYEKFKGGTKGPGVYLSNHSRYSAFWRGCGSPVIVCSVIAHEEHLKRFRSEIYSPQLHASEYLVKNPMCIFPKYVINYELVPYDNYHEYWNTNSKREEWFVKLGEYGCQKCDKKKKRCDCPQYPTILKSDLV